VSPFSRLADYIGPKLLLALVLIFALTLLFGIYAGRQLAYNQIKVDPATAKSMLTEMSALREALRVTRGDLEVQRTLHEVDKRALELLRSEMAAEKERSANLEEGLSFYRSMVASEDPGTGLSLRKPEIVPAGTPERFSYRFFVQQREREYEIVEGSLSVDVTGIQDEKEVRYPLSALSTGFNEKGATLHFRYFQAIEGEMVLPQGFEPKDIVLVARASKPRKSKVKKQFPWELQERFINVGK
jgi:Family of unknown function (DUF6776)